MLQELFKDRLKESLLKESYFSFKPNLFCAQKRIHRVHESRNTDADVSVIIVFLVVRFRGWGLLIDDAGVSFRYGDRSPIATEY